MKNLLELNIIVNEQLNQSRIQPNDIFIREYLLAGAFVTRLQDEKGLTHYEARLVNRQVHDRFVIDARENRGLPVNTIIQG